MFGTTVVATPYVPNTCSRKPDGTITASARSMLGRTQACALRMKASASPPR